MGADAFLLSACRTPIGAFGGSLKDLSAADLGAIVIELNEAVGSQSLAVMRELGWGPARVNVHGGAIALGHPIGARVLTTLVHALRERGARYGAASLCVGGGMGTAMIVERV